MKELSKVSLRSLIDPCEDRIAIGRQCELLGLARSSYYYTPAGETEENLFYMRLIDEAYLDAPFYGVGQMTFHLRGLGHCVNFKRVRRLMRLMGLRAVCPGPHTSKPGKGVDHQVFPYLLSGMRIDHVGQVVGVDITYIPMRAGFLYLVAFLDWYSRYVLSWELSNSMESSFCIEALSMACACTEIKIVNSDQGSQFTGRAFVEAVTKTHGATLSMDGKGRAIDNVFTERLWRSLKYEEVYLRSYTDGRQAWESIDAYIRRYNNQRPHSSLGGVAPYKVFSGEKKIPPLLL